MSIEDSAKDFFLFFAKFEYALKHGGYACADGKGRAKPDWEEFKKNCSAIETDDSDIRSLMAHPPKVQFFCDGELKWKTRDALSSQNTSGLIEACHTIRNNLFHGGKHSDGDQERNLRLLQAARKILELALERDSNVKAVFDQASL